MDTELANVIVKAIRAGVDGEIACLPPEMRSVPIERLMLGIAIDLEAATKPEPAPQKFHEGDWVHCRRTAIVNPCRVMGGIRMPSLRPSVWIRDSADGLYCVAQDECDLLPPRPGDDQMPSGWKLTGECRVPDKHSKGERFWSLIGEVDYALACSLHDGGFNGRRWIVVPVEAEKPSLLEQMEAICRDNDMFAVVRVLHDVAAAHKGNPDYEFYVTIQTPLSDVTFVPNT